MQNLGSFLRLSRRFSEGNLALIHSRVGHMETCVYLKSLRGEI